MVRIQLALMELGHSVSRIRREHVRVAAALLSALVVGIAVLAFTWEWKPALAAAIVANLLGFGLSSLLRRFRAT